MSSSKESSNGPDSDPDIHIAQHKRKMAEEIEKMSMAGAKPKLNIEDPSTTMDNPDIQQPMSKEEFENLMDVVTDRYPQFGTIMKNIPKTSQLIRTAAFKIPEKPVLPPSLTKMRQEAAEVKRTLKRSKSSSRQDKTRESSPDNEHHQQPKLSKEHDELFSNIFQAKRQERIDQELQKLADKFQQWDLSSTATPVTKQPPVKKATPAPMSEQAKQLKADIDTNKLLMEQTQLMTKIVQAIGTPTTQSQLNDIKKKTIEHAEKAIQIKKETTEQEEQMRRSTALTEKYQRTAKLPPKVPRATMPIVYLPKDVEAACGTYDPDNPKADFAKIWDNVLYMGKDNGYQTEDYLRALGYVLKGDAKDVYNQCRANNDDLEDILQRLTNAYAKQRTVTEDRRALENFTRKPAEPLLQCMSRCDIQIDKLQPFHTPEAWPSVREFFKRMALLQVVSQQTKKKILFREDDTIKTTGSPCDINQLISYADTYEVRHDEIPQTEVKTNFHCSAAEPIRKQDNQIKKMDQQIKQLKEDLSQMTQKVTAFSTATQDVTMTDTGIRPNKRPRQEDPPSRPATSQQKSTPDYNNNNRRPPPSSTELRRRSETPFQNRNDNRYNNNRYDNRSNQQRPNYRDYDNSRFRPETYTMSYEQLRAKQNQDRNLQKSYFTPEAYGMTYDQLRARQNQNRNYDSNYNSNSSRPPNHKPLEYNKPNYNKDQYDRGRSYYKSDSRYPDYRSKSYDSRPYDRRSYRDDRRYDKDDRYRRDYRSSSQDRNSFRRDNNRNYQFKDYDKYIIPDKSRITSIMPYRGQPTEVKQEGSGNIIFNMEGRPIKLFTEEEFRRQLTNSGN